LSWNQAEVMKQGSFETNGELYAAVIRELIRELVLCVIGSGSLRDEWTALCLQPSR